MEKLASILVEDWRQCWRWLSVQFSLAMVAWASLPAETQAAMLALVGLDQGKLVGLMGVAIILGRLIDQQRKQPARADGQ